MVVYWIVWSLVAIFIIVMIFQLYGKYLNELGKI